MNELWSMRTIGPDEVFAASSREAAETMAAELNAAIHRRNETDPRLAAEFLPPWTVVELWPWSAESHAKELEKTA